MSEKKASKAQQKAVHKYVKKTYDRLELVVPKGRKDEIKAHAEKYYKTDYGKGSVNAFVNHAINEQIKRDNSINKD